MFSRWWSLLALGGLACGTPTQLLVVVDTDLEPGVEIASIGVAVSWPSGGSDRRAFSLDSTELPFSLGIAPARRSDELVHVTATALSPSGDSVVELHVDTRFVPGEVRVLEMPLARACIMEPPCHDDGMTCLRGECVPEQTDSSSLPVRRGDEPRPLFDGPRVAPDAGDPDGGPACVQAEPCDTGDPCQMGRVACDPPRCEVASTLAAGTECGDGRVCDAEGRCGPLP